MAKIKRNYILNHVFRWFPSPGIFVEFGAYDGKTHSLGWYLAKRGWSGYFTEPVPESYRACKKNHANNKKIVVDKVAIGASDSWLNMHVAGLCSTGNNAFNEYTKKGVFKTLITGEEIKVRMTTLNNFLEKHNVPKGFEVLVVDVEAMEWEVFKGFDVNKWCPKAILVEMHRDLFDLDGVGEQYNQAEKFLIDRGYVIKLDNRVNTLFYGS